MENRINVILPLSDECKAWCEKKDLDVGPHLPMESPLTDEIKEKLVEAGFLEGKDYTVY